MVTKKLLMRLRNNKVIHKESEDTMVQRGEFDIDSQEDMTQRSDEQIPGSSQISDKETGVDNSNKQMLNMMN